MSEFSDIPREIGASDLPAGETVLWRGRPDWRHLALDAFKAPWVALYFVGIGTWHLSTVLHDGGTRLEALAAASSVVIPMIMSLSLVALLAWLSARSTRFTLTDRRLVMCYGMALPALTNLPLETIDAMRARRGFGRNGDIALTLPRKGRLAFHQLWPYARPWHLFPASPMLRSVPEVEAVKAIFASALKVAAEREALRLGTTVEAPAAQPVPGTVARPDYGDAAPAAA